MIAYIRDARRLRPDLKYQPARDAFWMLTGGDMCSCANAVGLLSLAGVCFLLLAVYIAFESASNLWFKRAPEHRIPGIVLACVSLE